MYKESGETMDKKNLIFGRNAVKEAILVDREIEHILVNSAQKSGAIRDILSLAKRRRLVVKEVPAKYLDEISENAVHQGVAALISAHKYYTVDEILELSVQKNEPPFVIIVDGVEDPHNLGAIIRTAECAGAHGVVIPKRGAVGLTSTVAKASAGALEHVRVARVTNISKTIEFLKSRGLWVYCADMDGKTYIDELLSGAVALVVGSEGAGVSRLVKKNCDFVLSIPLKGNISSLNVSVAAGILMYKVLESRMK